MFNIYNRGLQTTNSNLYFVALDTGHRLEIQFVPPVIEDERIADLGTMKIVGRNHPRYQNVGGEDTVALTLDFYADESSRQSVRAKVQWLKTLTHTDANRKPAQKVALVWGDMYKKEKWVVKRVRTKYTNFNAEFGWLPQQAIVDIQMHLDPDSNVTWEDVMPEYSEGRPDGQDPVSVTPARESFQDDFVVTSGNSFEEILRRTADRLRIG